jgi:hypothetical protein
MCDHPVIIGDNYGESCAVCGEILSGFGYNAESNYCSHQWTKCEYGEICLYCGALKEFLDNETNEFDN